MKITGVVIYDWDKTMADSHLSFNAVSMFNAEGPGGLEAPLPHMFASVLYYKSKNWKVCILTNRADPPGEHVGKTATEMILGYLGENVDEIYTRKIRSRSECEEGEKYSPFPRPSDKMDSLRHIFSSNTEATCFVHYEDDSRVLRMGLELAESLGLLDRYCTFICRELGEVLPHVMYPHWHITSVEGVPVIDRMKEGQISAFGNFKLVRDTRSRKKR